MDSLVFKGGETDIEVQYDRSSTDRPKYVFGTRSMDDKLNKEFSFKGLPFVYVSAHPGTPEMGMVKEGGNTEIKRKGG